MSDCIFCKIISGDIPSATVYENDEFKARFKGIKAPESTSEEMYNKNETTDTQVQALSGATVTSRAITRAVKGILFYDASGKEAGQYE